LQADFRSCGLQKSVQKITAWLLIVKENALDIRSIIKLLTGRVANTRICWYRNGERV